MAWFSFVGVPGGACRGVGPGPSLVRLRPFGTRPTYHVPVARASAMTEPATGPDAGIAIVAPGWHAVLTRIAAALERIADSLDPVRDPPGLTPAGPMILVDKGAELELSMSNIPLKRDGIQRLN